MGVELLVGAALLGGASTAYQAVEARGARKDAKKAAEKQQALVAKQEAKIEAEKQKQANEQEQRRARSMSKELLSGSETGITDETNAQLLG